MPLSSPKLVSHTNWFTVKKDAHFLIQRCIQRPASNKSGVTRLKASGFLAGVSLPEINSKNGQWRILMRCNRLCVGEFSDRTELKHCWQFLHPSDSYAAFDATGSYSVQQLWNDKMQSLQSHANDQSEEDFREQSTYLASVMSIMEVAKGILPSSQNATLEDTAATISLLVSLSRQLLITSTTLVNRMKASIVAHDIRMTPKSSSNSDIDPQLLEDPVSDPPISESTDKSNSDVFAINTSMLAPENPRLEGVEALVYHVDRLYSIWSKQEARIAAVVKQVLSRRQSKYFIKSNLFSSSIYYLPHIDKEAKGFDRKVMEEMAAALDKSLVPISDIYERLLYHINDRVNSTTSLPNPIGNQVMLAVQNTKQFLTTSMSKILGQSLTSTTTGSFSSTSPTSTTNAADSPSSQSPSPLSSSQNSLLSSQESQNQQLQSQHQSSQSPVPEEFALVGPPNYMDTLKADIDEYCELTNIGLQLSFDASSSASDHLSELNKVALKEVIVAQLYPQLIGIFRKLNDTKDSAFFNRCLALKNSITKETANLSDEFWNLLTKPGALDQVSAIWERFSDADSVRIKYQCLDDLSRCVYEIASDGLKRTAAAAGKPYDPSKPGDALRFAVGADDYIPMFAYILLQACTADVFSQFAFLSVFTDESELIGKKGYLLASIQTGILIIQQMPSASSSKSSSGSIKLNNEQKGTSIESSWSNTATTDAVSGSRSLSNSSNAPLSVPKSIVSKGLQNSMLDEFNMSDFTVALNPSSQIAVEHWQPLESSSFSKSSSSSSVPSGSSSSSANHTSDSSISENSSPAEKFARSIPSRLRKLSVEATKRISKPKRDPPPVTVLNMSVYKDESQLIIGEASYSLSLKILTLIMCLYQRFEKKLLMNHKQDQPNPLQEHELYRNYRDEVVHLQRVAVNSMSETQKTAFFLNVYHALMLHSFIEKGIPDAFGARFSILVTCAYNIGGKSLTLLEIEHGILRHAASYPSDLLDHYFSFPSKWKQSDWDNASYALKTMDPRMNFAICQFSASSPPLRIFTVENLETSLNNATSQYLNKSVLVHSENSCVILPMQFSWFAKDFGSRAKDLTQWASQYLDQSQQNALVEMKKYRIKFNEFDWTFSFAFEQQ